MNIQVYVASAFSKNGQGGNKAGVVFMKEDLSVSQKMDIAKQLGFAETAYISASQVADYKIEYFTPKEEVDLCGHATIGSFAIMMHLHMIDRTHYTIETKSGVLDISISDDMIFMEQNKPQFFEEIDVAEFTSSLDFTQIDEKYPIQIVSTGLRDILIPIKNITGLHALQPNFDEIKNMSERYDVIGTHLYTFEDDRIICRNFAPLYDINEEAATGTSNGALACYLFTKHKMKKELYVFEQGYALNSPSEILVKLDRDSNDEIQRVFVGGTGYFVEEKMILI
ncbi:PhzF family phenazine biosynthesis protein [Kurthia zopfii]|uniref:PhzF family phenazine biosynthesis protein n=1 Tax=Kurthia zopfii TaxID=1650 RepID=UPI000F714F61|nr:PhzF family phenazine biosynthesis protein [Kurthia zopfii]VEI05895.1 Uncharacterized isomerase yddE [Kurthia zopfii]